MKIEVESECGEKEGRMGSESERIKEKREEEQ